MAAPAGDGSFRTVPMGFDKNEVNAYIDKCRQRIQEAETFKKTCEDRISTAEKAADAAKKEVEEVKKQLMASSTEFEVRLKTERRNSDLLTNQIDELKRKLKNAGSARGASTAEAEKKSAEIINAANAQANDIVERAKKTAQDIISSAKSSVGGSGGAVSEEFIAEARKFVEIVNSGFKAVAAQAAALGTGAPAASVEMPDFSKIQAPQASVPMPAPTPVSTPTPAVNPQEVFAGISTETDSGDMFSFDSISDNSANEPITEVQPLNPMGEDMFNMDSMGGVGAVEAISPISENETVGFDESFTAALLAQSSAITEPESVGGSFGAEPPAADNPWASLQAEFNSLGNDSSAGIGGFDSGDVAPADNPWASLQAEFSSMSGGMDMGGFDGSDSTDLNESYNEDPQVPNTDDSSLWDFGGSNTGDDDMSSDLFGGF
ncbi:MAG: hypothetical protein HDT42_08740 [Ruminococcaceae bacterium]|nr:hypothetical protein [Oscillospiraceae bacterium]